MNRSERRRQAREGIKLSQETKLHMSTTYKLTGAEIDKMLEQASKGATRRAFAMMLAFPLDTLISEFGFGKQRLNKFMVNVMEVYHKYESDPSVTLRSLLDNVKDKTGITIKDAEETFNDNDL